MSTSRRSRRDGSEGEGSASNRDRSRLGTSYVRSSLLSILPDDFKDLLSTDGRTTTSQPPTMLSSISPGSSRAGTPHKRRSAFDFISGGRSASGDEKNKEQNSEEPSVAESKSTWRMKLASDLDQEASQTNFRPASSTIEGKDVSKRLEKLRERKEETKKVRQTKNREMKSLMEQVASIAAQSRGIMRAQPRQSEQQRLMGEIISLMGKMADKMSKLMLATEPPDEDEEDTSTKSPRILSGEEAEAKADQILVLLGSGGDDYELEWKRMEIKSILMSETEASRRRTTEKQKALEGLALDSTRSRSGRSESRRSRSSLSRQQSTRSTRSSRSTHSARSSATRRSSTGHSEGRSSGRSDRSKRRSKSVGEKISKDSTDSVQESYQDPDVDYSPLLSSP